MTASEQRMTLKQPAGNAALLSEQIMPIKHAVPDSEQLSVGDSASVDCEQLPAAVVALTVSYNGKSFHGFARQQGLPTIQGELEKALATVFRRQVVTQGAGRTDAGVHALGQVVSFGVDAAEIPQNPDKLLTSLNALVSDQISVRRFELREADFSARFSAQSREYRYRLYPSPTPPVFMAPYAWWLPINRPLNISALKAAAKLFEGERDFRSFCVTKSAQDISTVRTVFKVHVFGAQHLGEQCLMIQVFGSAFLHSMVRVMVGSLVEVARGERESSWISEVLSACDRRAAGETAPAHGLTLWQVSY